MPAPYLPLHNRHVPHHTLYVSQAVIPHKNRLHNASGLLHQKLPTVRRDFYTHKLSAIPGGFHAPVFSGPLHWFPLSVLLFVLIFPTVVSYLLVPIGLKYLKTTVVAIYGYLILIVATIVSLLVGQDRFSWSQTIAIGMICVSVYLVEVAETKEKPVSNSDKPSSLPPHGS